jgi:hypothetical protein
LRIIRAILAGERDPEVLADVPRRRRVINKHACALDCEGIVSKRFGSPWDYGRRTPVGCVMLRNQWTGGTLKMSEALIGQRMTADYPRGEMDARKTRTPGPLH